jgi:threonine dehydratase
VRTPLRRSPWLSEIAGADVYLKLETLQPTFSFKIRGAYNAVLRLTECGHDGRPLVTASAGNHGRALAQAAHDAGIRLTVYVPGNAPRTKLDAIAALGAELRSCKDYDEAEIRAKAHGATGEALFISPYSHPDVIAGAGTVGVEILEDQPGIDTFVVPIGGGGLISGIATAVRADDPGARRQVVGVEVEASSALSHSIAAGRIVPIDAGPTIADGLGGNLDPESTTFDIIRRLVSRIVLVSEARLKEAIAGIAREERIIVEGAGAAATAAVLDGAAAGARRVAVILSGANIDFDKLKALL